MAKSGKIEVSKITIKIGDKETPLTVEQAKELRDALTDLLGGEQKVIERVIEHDHWYPYRDWWVYRGPIYTSGDNFTTTNGTGHYTLSLNNAS